MHWRFISDFLQPEREMSETITPIAYCIAHKSTLNRAYSIESRKMAGISIFHYSLTRVKAQLEILRLTVFFKKKLFEKERHSAVLIFNFAMMLHCRCPNPIQTLSFDQIFLPICPISLPLNFVLQPRISLDFKPNSVQLHRNRRKLPISSCYLQVAATDCHFNRAFCLRATSKYPIQLCADNSLDHESCTYLSLLF